jgi:GNAT superfamily N-acetyltransferase
MVSDRKGILFRRSEEILQRDGLLPFIKRAFLFSLKSLVRSFRYGNYYIYEKTLNEMNEFKFTPKIQNVILKIICIPTEVDDLIAEGFDINSYLPTDELKTRINKRAILFCVFVGKELAHTSWVALDNKANMDPVPFEIDWQNEACLGPSYTNPKYRGLGVYTFVMSKIYKFLKEKGWLKAKFTVNKKYIAPQKAHAKLGTKIVGEARHLKLLLWEFWRVKPLKEAKRRDGK